MYAIEKRARELLAAQCEIDGMPEAAEMVRAGTFKGDAVDGFQTTIRAIIAALTPPEEPDHALLVSMAICLDHGFGMATPERQQSRLHDMRKLWDEVMGRGYYTHENRERYVAMLAARPEVP